MASECSLPCSKSLISISARIKISSLLHLLFLLLFACVKPVGVFARPISPFVYFAVITVLSRFIPGKEEEGLLYHNEGTG